MMDGWIDDRWIDGWINRWRGRGWMGEWMDGRMDMYIST